MREYGYLLDALRDGLTDLAVAMTLVCTTSIRQKFNSIYQESETR